MNFAALDLNLLRVFDAMVAEGNTGRAGARVGLSQPAVSAALGRLRHATGDPLFVRESNRMVPTARAEALASPIRAALSTLERSLAAPLAFEPATAARRFRIHGSDYFSSLIMPPLSALAEAAAPGVVLGLLDLPGGPETHLAGDTADLCLGMARPVPEWVDREELFASHLVGVAARDHPALTGVPPEAPIPVEIFARLPHAIVSGDGATRGSLDGPLEAAGIVRRIALTLPHFHAVALAVAEGSLIAALPVHFARAVAPRLGLSVHPLPVPSPQVRIAMFWHGRHRDDPGNRWLRDRVRDACAPIIAQVDGISGSAPPGR